MSRRYKVIWTPAAQGDLESVVAFTDESPVWATNWTRQHNRAAGKVLSDCRLNHGPVSISRESIGAASRIFRAVRLKASSLYRYPDRGRIVPELAHIPGLSFRELILSPWRLIYLTKKDRVEVLAFFDGRRDLSEILFERISR